MEGNAARFIRALREHDYYPSIDPPTFEREGDRLGIARPNGVGGRFLPRSRELQVGKGDNAIPSWENVPDALAVHRKSHAHRMTEEIEPRPKAHDEVVWYTDGNSKGRCCTALAESKMRLLWWPRYVRP